MANGERKEVPCWEEVEVKTKKGRKNTMKHHLLPPK